jgi:PPOX class probable F420-dependent enzyme
MLEQFAGQKTVILTSFRRDGTPVDTPVHIVVDGGQAYIRTYAKAMKTKRLRRNPEVELRLASNGTQPALLALSAPKAAKRVGMPVRARATLLSGEESQRAARLLARRYPFLHGVLIPRLHRLMASQYGHTVNVRLTPAGGSARPSSEASSAMPATD